MGSFQARTYFYVTAKQTTNLAATNRTTLGNLPLCLPSADEQLSILEQVKAESGAQDDAIAKARRQIDLINEYRTRLIADGGDGATGRAGGRRTVGTGTNELNQSQGEKCRDMG